MKCAYEMFQLGGEGTVSKCLRLFVFKSHSYAFFLYTSRHITFSLPIYIYNKVTVNHCSQGLPISIVCSLTILLLYCCIMFFFIFCNIMFMLPLMCSCTYSESFVKIIQACSRSV